MIHSKVFPFEGLTPLLVKDILAQSGQIADEIYEQYQTILGNREKLRERLQQHIPIQKITHLDELSFLTMCGIDGCYSSHNLLVSELAALTVFAVEGLVPPSGGKYWNSSVHNAVLLTEKQCGTNETLMKAIIMEMEFELAGEAPHNIIIINGSCHIPFVTIMDSLKIAIELKETKSAQEYMKRIKSSLTGCATLLNSQNTKKMWVGISENSSLMDITNTHFPGESCGDGTLLTLLLSPGEYTTPCRVNYPELSSAKNLPIKDEKFASLKNALISSFEEFRFIYYRPCEWTPAMRIECSPSIADSPSHLAFLLNSITFQYRSSCFSLPYPLYQAGQMIRNMNRAFSSLTSIIASQISHLHQGDIQELVTLLLSKDTDRGDNHE
jgi:hypothetical protein